MSDDDGAKGSGEEDEKRPETAADRRARRRAERDAAKEPAAVGAGKGGSSPAKRGGSGGAGSKADDEQLPFPKRIVRYLRQVVDELRKVIWPTRKQMVTYTIVVLAFLAFMIALVWGLDWVLGQGVFALFGE